MASQTSSQDSARGGRPALSIGSHISVSREKGLITALAVLFGVMIVVTLVTCEEAFRAWRHWGGYQLFSVGCFSPFAALASLISFLGGLKSLNDLADKDQLVAKVKGIVGEDVMMFGLYLTLVAGVGMGVLGGCCVFYQEEIELVLQAQFADANVANALYPGITLADVSQSLHSSYATAGYLCFAYLLLAFVSFLIQLSLSLDHESTHSILQVEAVVQLCLALFIVLTGKFCLQVTSDFDWEEVPKAGLQAGIWLGVAAGVLAVYGFYVGKWEDVTHIVCHGMFGLIFVLFALYFLTMQLQATANLQHSLSEGCLDTMSLVESRYMQALGCPQKYSQTAATSAALTCPKAQQRLLWEESPDKTLYACLNLDCCGYLVASTKVIVDYLGVSMLLAAAITAMSILTSIVLLTKIAQKGVSMFHNADAKIMLAMGLILAIGGGLIYAIVPLSPRPKPDLSPAITVLGAGLLQPWQIQEGVCVRAPLLTIRPYMLQGGRADSSSVEVMFTAHGGYLGFSEQINEVNVTARQTDLIKIEGNDPTSLTKALQSVVFCAACPFLTTSLDVNITRKDYGRVPGRMLDAAHYELQAQTSLFARSFSMFFPTPSAQSIASIVEFEDEGIKGVTVSAHSLQSAPCVSAKAITDPLGAFNLSVPKTPNGSPYRLALEFTSPGYVDMSYIFRIGGMPAVPLVVPVVDMMESKKVQGKVEAVVVGVRNERLENVTIEVRSGIGNDTGASFATRISDNQGKVVFSGLPLGPYTLSTGSGYYTDSREVIITGNHTYSILLVASPLDLGPDQIRIVLTWLRDDLDLDLRAMFESSVSHICDVHYADKHCGGAKLYALSDAGLLGGEILTLRQVSPASYLFYVTSSRPGDFASAEIKVYSPSSPVPVLRLPFTAERSEGGSWLALCLNGLQGLESLSDLNSVKTGVYGPSLCEGDYGRVRWGKNSTRIERKGGVQSPAGLFVGPPRE
jgi:hypothetical protein